LLALNGLRVCEATGANIEALGVERGHRTLVITRKGGKVVTSRVWRHSQITWTCCPGGLCIANRGCQRAGSLPPLP
jgi:hypothetical protein